MCRRNLFTKALKNVLTYLLKQTDRSARITSKDIRRIHSTSALTPTSPKRISKDMEKKRICLLKCDIKRASKGSAAELILLNPSRITLRKSQKVSITSKNFQVL